MEILNKEQIRANLDIQTAISQIEKGFVAYSKGEAAVPPVGHLPFDTGDCHIKYGHIPSDPYFVIKIATGFNTNRAKGLPASNGMMIIMEGVNYARLCIGTVFFKVGVYRQIPYDCIGY